MKKLRLEQLPGEVQTLLESLESGRVLITRNGEPFALVASVGFKDEEDLELEESPEFWEMIRERRRAKATKTLEEVMAELAAEDPSQDGGGDVPPTKTEAGLVQS